MKKIVNKMLIIGLGFAFISCSKSNTKPEITGVNDSFVKAGVEFNAMEGVSAIDKEDGNITSKIMIDATPSLTFKNGKTTVENAGSYELVYSVTDKDGNTVEAYSTLTVSKKTADAAIYKSFDFTTEHKAEDFGWKAKVADSKIASGSLKKGAYVFEIKNPGNGDGDIQLAKSGFAVKAADYKIRVWAKSTKDTY